MSTPYISHEPTPSSKHMLSRRCLSLQTELIDLFLPELSQPCLNGVVNFNNTKQFDTLLRHLEITSTLPTFNAVPSSTILHILFTLLIRAPSLNWSHDASPLDLLATSEYMKQVNKLYDSALYRKLLLQRAQSVLGTYIDLVANSQTAATDLLYERLHECVSLFVTTSYVRPYLKRQTKQTPIQYDDLATPLYLQENAELSTTHHAVEVISDSEESDAIVDADMSIITADLGDVPHQQSVKSFTELGSRTSGLGETAVLFKDMPHLLAQATPEALDTDEPRAKRQRRFPSIEQIRVFDDVLLFKRLRENSSCNVWALLRWTFWCAEVSSQYQRFLFNSCHTKVHELYVAYKETFRLLLRVCDCSDRDRFPGNLRRRLFEGLGFGTTADDRAVEFIFTGLGISSQDTPTPYFSREKLLLSADKAVNVSRSKEEAVVDDNKDSMEIRIRLLNLLFSAQSTDDNRSIQIVEFVSMKLALLLQSHVRTFLQKASHFLKCAGHSDQRGFFVLLAHCCVNLLVGKARSDTSGPALFSSAALVAAISRNGTFVSIFDVLTNEARGSYKEKWNWVVFLTSWVLVTLLNLHYLSDDDLLVAKKNFSAVFEDAKKIFDTNHRSGSEAESDEEYFTPRPDSFTEDNRSIFEVTDKATIDVDDSIQELTMAVDQADVQEMLATYKSYILLPIETYLNMND
ncbi:hypothetical protein PUMCH_004146 [Australozyma saopauloensis]|uniref:Uncharacterized protein n=1 Tax=Australozyma saopauloensis TaxID=291208 RepID=A0AAX4HE13_9ASCO|nr:hypothetical protein PUMCH_004146 [[Candida] saopauloensis]